MPSRNNTARNRASCAPSGSNAKQIWAKNKPMNDEELLFQQVQMTTSASPETTVWVYRCSVYAYPWYTSVRTILDDPAYSPWFIKFKPTGPYFSPQCDSNYDPPLCRCARRGGEGGALTFTVPTHTCLPPRVLAACAAATTSICRSRRRGTPRETATARRLPVTAARSPAGSTCGTTRQPLSSTGRPSSNGSRTTTCTTPSGRRRSSRAFSGCAPGGGAVAKERAAQLEATSDPPGRRAGRLVAGAQLRLPR